MSAAFSQDGDHIVSACWDGFAYHWVTTTGKLNWLKKNHKEVQSLKDQDHATKQEEHLYTAVLSANGQYLLTANSMGWLACGTQTLAIRNG